MVFKYFVCGVNFLLFEGDVCCYDIGLSGNRRGDLGGWRSLNGIKKEVGGYGCFLVTSL